MLYQFTSPNLASFFESAINNLQIAVCYYGNKRKGILKGINIRKIGKKPSNAYPFTSLLQCILIKSERYYLDVVFRFKMYSKSYEIKIDGWNNTRQLSRISFIIYSRILNSKRKIQKLQEKTTELSKYCLLDQELLLPGLSYKRNSKARKLLYIVMPSLH